MEKSQNRRRNYFIKKEFQRRFIMKFCLLVALGALISGIIIYAMSLSTVTTSFENSRLTIKSTADYVLPAVLLSSVIVIILIGLATIMITLFTSHKIAGPLYRIEKDVGEIVAGNLKIRFNLRKDDEIKPLAAALDTMIKVLRAEIEEANESVSKLESAIEKLEKNDEKEKLREKIQSVKIALGKFKT